MESTLNTSAEERPQEPTNKQIMEPLVVDTIDGKDKVKRREKIVNTKRKLVRKVNIFDTEPPVYEEDQVYPNIAEDLRRPFPQPVQMDTVGDADELIMTVESHLATLEHETILWIEKAIKVLDDSKSVLVPVKKLAQSMTTVVQQLLHLHALREKEPFRMNLILTGGYRSLHIHLGENCRDVIEVMTAKRGSAVKLAHFRTKSLSDGYLMELIEPRVATFAIVEERLKLIEALWVVDEDGTKKYCPLRPMEEICDETGIQQGKIYAKWHFGYQSQGYLCTYALCMKALHVCCAESREWGRLSKMLPGHGALVKLPGYMTNSEDVVEKYKKLREEGMPLEVLRGMWNLMEDKILCYLANRMSIGISDRGLWYIPKVNPLPIVLGTCVRLRLPTQEQARGRKQKEKGFPCTLLSRSHLSVNEALVESGQTVKRGLQASVGVASRAAHKLKSSASSANSIAVLHMHGGGFLSQSPQSHLVYLKDWAKRTKLPILSVDYALSPEAMFPQALEECIAIYKWLQLPTNCASIGLAETGVRIILAGDSAGGNLCLAVANKIIGDADPTVLPPIGMLLHYPVAFLSMSGSISRILFENDPILNYQAMARVAQAYLGSNDARIPFEDHLFSPGLAPDSILEKYPPTYLAIGDVDPLHDDSLLLYERFDKLGVRSVLRFYRHLPHGFLNLPVLPGSYSAAVDAAAFLKYLARLHEDPSIGKEYFEVKKYRAKLESIRD